MNKKDMLNSIRNSTKKAEVVDNALKHLGGTAMDYLAFDFDDSRMLGAFSQFNNNNQFVGDLDAVLSNNGGNEQLKTKRDLIVEIFRNLIMLSFTEDETERSGIITTLSGLYELETKYNDWELIFEQVHTTLMPELFFQELHVRFRRELKKFEVWITFVEGNSTAYTLELEASLETHEITTIKPMTTPPMLYYLGTSNMNEYTPEGDYNPATKKYVDDKTAPPIVWGATIHTDTTDTTTIKIENIGELNKKLNLGTASKPNIILDFRYKKPNPMPSITPGDLAEVNLEGSLYVDASLTNVTTQYNFHDDGILQDGSKCFFQNGEKPNLEAGHRYQIFVSYYVNYNQQIEFATVGVVDFGAVNGSAPAPAPAGN